uniref:Eukaryotic translation initiation factor 2 subunit 2 n=1 Tax=Hirondellea gigas TaxID=1518452 RepID=A0A2P2HWL2_9CRUS
MADDNAIFDPTVKKRKKKTGFILDAALAAESVDTVAIDAQTLDFDNVKDVVPEIETTVIPNVDMDVELDFTAKKKKTKKKKVDIEKLIAEDEKENQHQDKDEAWGDSERDYSYDELLQRAFDQLREKNPEMAAGEKKKFVMKPPQVLRIGSKKSAFANFNEICRLLHRIPKHVLQFLLAELGTSGSIDGNNQLIIKGRFQQKQIENVLRRYIKEYVTCHTCRSSDTILQKDARLYFLQCEQCNSRCSVAPIKSGFQAVANKQQRQAIRASKN